MHSNFEEIISCFLEKRVGISNDFLSTELASHLKSNLLNLYKNEDLITAGIGNDRLLNYNKEIRSDKIFWLDRAHDNIYENEFFDLIDSFVKYLNNTCYTGIKSHEFHYALYEKGTFYQKHIDQFKSDDRRVFTMIMYLNEGWTTADGGELKVYQESGIQLISPENKKCVFFKSNELPHEVLLSNVSRSSVTGWLKT
ncbi:2OG-Fe(II) oxygenase [Labilibacter marinus]|uniref:2OG-Fe(II) oxygenase n=1 Tax=Labilibacter marinus TaxID=1477105 RepID=UPI0008333E1A|nr:2OG-Fe(II) oxygenase [Labilibacter marinus]